MTRKEINVTGFNVAELRSLIEAKDIPDSATLDADITYEDFHIITLNWVEDH